jgi:hypothetical protein
LQKIDGKLLAQKAFPYLDVNVVATQRLGQVSDVKVSGIKFKTAQATASCAPDEIAVGGGFWHSTGGDIKISSFLKGLLNGNRWTTTTLFDGDGRLSSYV